MLCGIASWAAALLYASCVMLGPVGKPVNNHTEHMTAVVLRTQNETKEEVLPTPNSTEATVDLKNYVPPSKSLCAAEREFVLKRKQVALKSLKRLGLECTLESVPHIALLGSGGGQRAAVGLVGSLYQLEKDGLLDSVLYLGGISGSAWAMSSLYSDPQWSANMSGAVSRLSRPRISLEQALVWLDQRANEEHFSLSDVWGLLTSVEIMKEMDLRRLSDDASNAFNPYPIYNAVNKHCQKHNSEGGKWFEMTPHEAGFTDLGFFINTSRLGSQTHNNNKNLEMDMVRLQGIVGSAVADEQTLVDFLPDWLKGLVGTAMDEKSLMEVVSPWAEVPQQIKDFLSLLDHYMRGYHSLVKLVELIRKNTEDPEVLSWLDNLEKTLKEHLNINPKAEYGKTSPEQQKQILEQWHQNLAPMQTWIQSLNETQIKNTSFAKVFPLIWKWEWGTIANFLYQYPGGEVPSCIRLKEHLQLIDASVMLNMPFPPFLGEKRDVDLLIALDYGAGGTFETLTLAREYAATVRKPFPEIDDKILEERDWPQDCYVFEGKEKEPTIVYMPLFNRRNCRDAKELKAKMEEFSSFQLPFSQEKIEFLLEVVKTNMRNNKKTLLREVNKAALRRYNKSINQS